MTRETREQESIEDVRDRLSAFVGEGNEGDEERPGEPTDGPMESGSYEADSGGERIEGDTEESRDETRGNNLIIKTAVREHVEGMAVASDFYEPLNKAVNELLADAARRARANGRKTVQTHDL